MAKKTENTYTGERGSSHTRLGKLPGVNVGRNPDTGKPETINASGPQAREALIAELRAADE